MPHDVGALPPVDCAGNPCGFREGYESVVMLRRFKKHSEKSLCLRFRDNHRMMIVGSGLKGFVVNFQRFSTPYPEAA